MTKDDDTSSRPAARRDPAPDSETVRPTDTDHPVGEEQASENAENELPG